MNLPASMTLTRAAQGDADAVHEIKFPFGVMITAVSLTPAAFTGTPTGFTIDLNVDGEAALAALAANEAGTPVIWKSKHHQGTAEVIRVPKNGVLSVDVNLAEGTDPTVSYDLVVWFVQGTV